LAGHEVDADAGWRRGTEIGFFPGCCYETALRFCRAHPEEHGLVVALGQVDGCDHVWVELPGDVVFDGTFQRFYAREAYYAITRATVRERLPAGQVEGAEGQG
jgi:hypothetical protein